MKILYRMAFISFLAILPSCASLMSLFTEAEEIAEETEVNLEVSKQNKPAAKTAPKAK